MLGGCVPVAARRGAPLEVVGDAGVLLESREAPAVADGIREALVLGPGAPGRARDRVLSEFRCRCAGAASTTSSAGC